MAKVLDLRVLPCAEFIEGAYRTRVRDLQFHALPPPTSRLLILEDAATREEVQRISSTAARDAGEFLKLRGWERVELFANCSDLVNALNGLVEIRTSAGHQGVLWEPNPLLKRFFDCGAKDLRDQIVLDAGAGAGRDAVLLARRGAFVIAVEARRTLGDACERLCKMADVSFTRCAGPVRPRIRTGSGSGGGRVFICQGKLDATFLLELGAVDVVHVSRFFQRELTGALMCAARSYFLCHHFLSGSCRPCGAEQVLRDVYELVDLAIGMGMTVISDDVLEVVDHVGLRKLSMFICQKPN